MSQYQASIETSKQKSIEEFRAVESDSMTAEDYAELEKKQSTDIISLALDMKPKWLREQIERANAKPNQEKETM
jgi:hypothetical protein